MGRSRNLRKIRPYPATFIGMMLRYKFLGREAIQIIPHNGEQSVLSRRRKRSCAGYRNPAAAWPDNAKLAGGSKPAGPNRAAYIHFVASLEVPVGPASNAVFISREIVPAVDGCGACSRSPTLHTAASYRFVRYAVQHRNRQAAIQMTMMPACGSASASEPPFHSLE